MWEFIINAQVLCKRFYFEEVKDMGKWAYLRKSCLRCRQGCIIVRKEWNFKEEELWHR